MSDTSALVDALKQELKAAQVTYAELARRIGMSESSVKRMFSQREMTLSRVDDICRAIRIDFADLARAVADRQVLVQELTLEQERAIVRDRVLLLVGICCLSQWTFEQIVATYRLSEPECIHALTRLDRLGVLELRPLNRYRMKLAKTFRWRPDGPIMQFFRQHVLPDYFTGRFARHDETLLLVHGSIGHDAALALRERITRLAHDFAQQQLADQRLPASEREGYTMILAMREWEFAAFTDLRR
jgi:DNA-binding Xre family transcriptional regulator